ncbi:MAG: helix-turn-helix domain-containing protein [Nitrososphaerales archaeon]|jgi:sugar-specific transcriptional regulator TrmB
MDRRAIIEQLRTMRLTAYEAKCYVSLAELGPADPRKVAAEAGIPYPNAYEALKRLAALGWVDLVVRRPATYRARRPESVRAMVSSMIEETFDSLEKVYSPEPAEEAELIYTLRGREKVLAKMYEMLRGAKESVVLVAPTVGLEDARLLELLSEAIDRGVNVKAIGDESAPGLLPPAVEIRTGNLVAIDLLVDNKMALISLLDYSACGWVDSPAVASHFKQFLELLWNTSSPP